MEEVWKETRKANSLVNFFVADDPCSDLSSRRDWCLFSRFQSATGQYAANLHQWDYSYTDNSSCIRADSRCYTLWTRSKAIFQLFALLLNDSARVHFTASEHMLRRKVSFACRRLRWIRVCETALHLWDGDVSIITRRIPGRTSDRRIWCIVAGPVDERPMHRQTTQVVAVPYSAVCSWRARVSQCPTVFAQSLAVLSSSYPSLCCAVTVYAPAVSGNATLREQHACLYGLLIGRNTSFVRSFVCLSRTDC